MKPCTVVYVESFSEGRCGRISYGKVGLSMSGASEAAATACNGKIYISGGRGDGPVYFKSVECFDPESGVWTELTDMPTPRLDHCLVWYRNRLAVIRGWDRKQMTTTVMKFDPLEENGQWKELPSITFPGYTFTGAVLGREIFTIGRIDIREYFIFMVQIFDGIKWLDGPTLPVYFHFPDTTVLVSQEFADRLCQHSNAVVGYTLFSPGRIFFFFGSENLLKDVDHVSPYR